MKRALNDQSRLRPMTPMNRRYRCAALGRVAMSFVGDWCGVDWAYGKVHLADTRLEPASHANTKNP
jgi:hypothetical protein